MNKAPFDTFRLEKKAGEYKDFHLPTDSTYPLRGITYPVNYGDIEGYIAEDQANLDVFIGDNGTLHGYIKVSRPDLEGGEHKFYINVTEDEEKAVLEQFSPVIIEHVRVDSIDELIQEMEPFRQLAD
jgi:hypothetical protein